MIFSDRQRAVAHRELAKLQNAYDTIAQDVGEDDQTWLKLIEANALKSQIDDIQVELQEYDMLRAGEVSFSERYSLADLPRILIQARIAQGLSQSDLASELNMKPQQVQRYEATEYMGASLSRLIAISDRLGVRTSESFTTDSAESGSFFSWSTPDDVAWDKFPGAEMIKRGWFKLDLGQSISDGVRSYFERTAGQQFATALHRKKVRGVNLPNEIPLLAWQMRVLHLAKEIIAERKVPRFSHDDAWISSLVKLTQASDGPRRAKDLLFEHGIILVIEPHLSGSYLDGAAMMSGEDHPIIGMTLRYDRLDNFWFVLFHELGHVFLHLFENLHIDFFDEEGARGQDRLENEADAFALNALIPDERWALCLSRFALTEAAVKLDADRLSVEPSIIAGRIRKERNDFTLLTNLIGQGEVRHQFAETQS